MWSCTPKELQNTILPNLECKLDNMATHRLSPNLIPAKQAVTAAIKHYLIHTSCNPANTLLFNASNVEVVRLIQPHHAANCLSISTFIRNQSDTTHILDVNSYSIMSLFVEEILPDAAKNDVDIVRSTLGISTGQIKWALAAAGENSISRILHVDKDVLDFYQQLRKENS